MQAEGTFRGRLTSFGEVRALAEGFGTAVGVERSAILRVVLVLEELFTNTVTHGYPPGAEGPVWVTLAAEGSGVEVTYEDAGSAFDPLTEGPPPPDPTHAFAGQPPGGMGLALVLGLSTGARYARVGDRNRITLTVPTAEVPRP
jgi:anti-sigma regulatory factor (Ser/Thr protein kinase)